VPERTVAAALRVEAARPRVEDGRESLEGIDRKSGFGDADRMRESFVRVFGQTPLALRSLARRTDARLKPDRT
jgi:transcriptional regulator GlxA family with amidase domain